MLLLSTLLVSANIYAQVPNWIDPVGEYTNTMIGTFTISDECVPSMDANDIVAVFDLAGNIRGVRQTSNNFRAFLTIRGESDGELLYFKVYDAGTNKVYNIYNTSIVFLGNGSIASPSSPMILNFDSAPTNVNAGEDQEVFNKSFTTLEAEGIGKWSVVEGLGGSFVDNTNPKTVFNGVIGRKYILAWTLDETEGCIGETDEVIIYLVLDEPENNTRTCGDGLDNDGDGIYDCEDTDCGQPTISDFTYVEPTAIDCNTTLADGSFTVVSMNADQFSLDNGVTSQASATFADKNAGVYQVYALNTTSGCNLSKEAILRNSLDVVSGINEMNVMGPSILCMGLKGVDYSLDIPRLGDLTWSYTGTGVTLQEIGDQLKVDFATNATAGGLIGTLSSQCSSKSDTLAISFASAFLCSFSNCPKNISITTGVLESANSPQVYRAELMLTSDALIENNHFEFTAGVALNFENGFTVTKGLNFIADIKTCNK